jgi:hypothetical protein
MVQIMTKFQVQTALHCSRQRRGAEPSQSARATKLRYREKPKQNGHGGGQRDQPVRNVAGPGARCGVQPSQRQHSENRAGHLVKKLLEDAP